MDTATAQEEIFNAQRAKLKELYLQKEGDFVVFALIYLYELLLDLSFPKLDECIKLNEQLVDLRKELNETKSQVVVAEYKRETDIQNQDRRAQEEIASLQHLVHGKSVHCQRNNAIKNESFEIW